MFDGASPASNFLLCRACLLYRHRRHLNYAVLQQAYSKLGQMSVSKKLVSRREFCYSWLRPTLRGRGGQQREPTAFVWGENLAALCAHAPRALCALQRVVCGAVK